MSYCFSYLFFLFCLLFPPPPSSPPPSSPFTDLLPPSLSSKFVNIISMKANSLVFRIIMSLSASRNLCIINKCINLYLRCHPFEMHSQCHLTHFSNPRNVPGIEFLRSLEMRNSTTFSCMEMRKGNLKQRSSFKLYL